MASLTGFGATVEREVAPWEISRVDVRLSRVPVDPPRGDAIQKFTALELPIVQITDGA